MDFQTLCEMNFKDQCVWFLNGFWDEENISEEANTIFSIYESFISLDLQKNGSSLDQFNSHRLLEKYEETLTVVELRATMADIDANHDNRLGAIEYLIFKYNKTVAQVIKAPQGSAPEHLILEAKKKMADVQKALSNLLKEMKELEEAIAECKKIEEEIQAKCSKLEKMSIDENLGVVKRNRAANELEQIRAEDPLPLRKAKITQEAALRKVNRGYVALQKNLEAAELELEVLKAKGGVGNGELYFMEKELFDADA
eukprot:Pgem_evm1s4117